MCRIIVLYLLSAFASLHAGEGVSVEVVVYGGTAGGAMASIGAAKQGAKVVLLEPGRHVGGMVSGGLGHTDVLRQERLIGGLAREFFRRVGRHYSQEVAWEFEPHVAEQTLKTMLSEANVPVRFGQRLASVVKEGGRLRSLKTTDGTEYSGRVFIDASYEGDLMKGAGVSYTVGREGRERYNESLAGRRELVPGEHQFKFLISPWKDGRLLPYITPEEKLVPTGAGDGKFQAYCFRLCLTDVPENRLPIPRPEGYDPGRYELLGRYFAAGGDKVQGALGTIRLPNGKCDANSSGPISTDLLGANQDYPEGTPERRAQIWEEHRAWAHGLLYYLQNDPAVPAKTRAKYSRWGLCKDEFLDTGGWPHQLYIREGRRMTGEYILTQHDLMTNRRKPDCIGLAGYNIDLREVQWVSVRTFFFPKAEDKVFLEGYASQPVEPWDIPYRALLPRLSECQNLLVSVCASASTVAYASFRLEPQYMIAGQAAGVAAALASRKGTAVHDVPIPELQRLLRAEGQVLDVP